MKDPYVYEGTNVLINLANIKAQSKLDDFETTLSRVTNIELQKNSIEITSPKDIFEIHKRLFKEVYSWVGHNVFSLFFNSLYKLIKLGLQI